MLSVARYGTRDLDRSMRFYDAIAEIIGARRVLERPDAIGYQADEGGMFLVGKPLHGEATVGNGTQVGFHVASRAIVDAAHAKALELDGACEGAPGVRGPDAAGFYAAYFRDPDGNKVMVFRSGPA